MYHVPKTSRWQYGCLQQSLYLVNIGLYSLMVFLTIFSASKIVRWWLDDPRYELDYATFIWLPIGLLLLSPFIWQRMYALGTLAITGSSLLLLNIFLMVFLRVDFSDADQIGWSVVILFSVAITLVVWYRAKPWRKFNR
ncbi:MAG TPA: hypothetical protein DEF47_13715 [Herpetosiphon sp.]|uniref:Uncharacterized protein n=1 Tax=Herpetosiphon aurantiacus (strain ATCC 23779 / DSM 785 / 114-95) TaxID=316274 RepID=A9AZ15_HERA2|nr:hypothetical protein [Herpetosiphon sp.]ABX07055.1 hypothetical protein Haur_4423 [Herpetosiphon aurantiacus DSM 785]HBW50946.1 hypothetical protein [Herpetosiphon sp.]